MKLGRIVIVAGVLALNFCGVSGLQALQTTSINISAPSGLLSLIKSNSVPAPSGLVSWWRGEGDASDSVGANNGVQVGNVQYAAGKVGQGFLLNGTNAYIRIPYSSTLSFSNALTIELWYKCADAKGGGLVNKRNNESGPINYGTLVTPGAAVGAYFNDPNVVDSDAGGTFETSVYSPTPPAGNFHHLAVTWQQQTSNSLVVLTYIDGQLLKTRTFNANLARAVNTAPVTIGVYTEYPDYGYFNGVIDEVSLYNRALSSNEVADIYNAGSAGKIAPTNALPPSGLVGWWKGDGNADDSVSGNNGTLVNGSYTNGVVGQAFSFDPELLPWGTWTGVQIADRPEYALTNALTIEGWVRPRGDGYLIFFRGDHRPGLDPYYLSMQANNTIRFGITDADGNPAYVETTINYFNWTHVAAELDGNAGTLSIYTNGVLAVQLATNVRPFGDLLPDQSPGIGIGNVNDGGNQFPFVGDLDEISLYNRALTVGEIRAIFNAGSAGKTASTNTFLPADLVAWWPGEGNVTDVIGGNNGTPVGDWRYTNGEVGMGFVLDGNTTYVPLSASSNLDIGPAGTGITIECWIKPDSHNATPGYGGPLVEWDADNSDGLQLWAEGGNNLFANVMDVSGTPHTLMTANDVLQTDQWQHVALTYDKISGLMAIYVNGSVVVSNYIGTVTPRTTYPEYHLNIGRRTGQVVGLNDTYSGGLDELSLYKRALTAGEIQAIFHAGSVGKGVDLNSSKPLIISQPASQTVVAGGQADFSVTAIGVLPLSYQWTFNGTNIAGAVGSTLTLTNLHASQGGSYCVTVSNSQGSVKSDIAVLTVMARDILVYNYNGSEKFITAGAELSYNYSGRMFFVPGGTNGVFVGWATLNGKKQYWVSPFSDYLWITIPGSGSHVYTVLGRAGDGLDDNGQPHLWSYLHRGLNSQLTIGTKKKFSFPMSFACNDTHIYPDPNNGNMILREATSTYLFTTPDTQSANNNGQTLADVVNVLTQSLAKQGYQKQ
jgi:hypothetical protein